MRPKLITVSGVDCSGKSTQIDLLRRALMLRGHRPTVFWHRPGYSRELDALRAAVRRVRPGLLPTAQDPKARARVLAQPGVRRTWVAVATLDLLYQYGLKVRAMLAGGRTVICDRYIPDALLDFQIAFPEFGTSSILREIMLVCPKPDCAILLLLPKEEMLHRMTVKAEPFGEPPEQRVRRHAAYSALEASGELRVIDAAQPVAQVHANILQHLAL